MAGLGAQQTCHQTDSTGRVLVQQVPPLAQLLAELSVELVPGLVLAMSSAADCTRREWKRSYRMGWSSVAGVAAVGSGNFAVASDGFGPDSEFDSWFGFAKGLLVEGPELGSVVVMTVVAVAAAAETMD